MQALKDPSDCHRLPAGRTEKFAELILDLRATLLRNPED